MSITISNINMPSGCQKCKFFNKDFFGNGLDYSYSCILGAKDFPMPWIRQMEERASDCPIKTLEQEPVLDKIRTEIERVYEQSSYMHEGEDWRDGLMIAERIIDTYREGSEEE